MNKRMKQIVMLCLVGFALGTTSAWMQVNEDNMGAAAVAGIEPAAGNAMAGAEIGGSFTLTDHHGNVVTDKDYADSYKLVFFGFTFCPDVCPAGLQKITTALDKIGNDANQIQPLFITVDPARDTPEVMKEYVGMFHPQFVGLTGSAEQIKAVEKAYKVYAAKVEDPELSDYTMNHSSYTFLMSPDNQLISLFSADDSPEEMATGIKRVLQSN